MLYLLALSHSVSALRLSFQKQYKATHYNRCGVAIEIDNLDFREKQFEADT